MTDTASASPHAEPRPLGRAALALVLLGALFYTSYGFANWLSAQRSGVPSIVFGWERAIPFLPWTIVPYWSTNLLYAGSVLACRTRRELRVQVIRLLVVQLVAIACFIVFPLKFSWPKPDTTGMFGAMFEALGAFDKPFNQAPSLHVALTVALFAFYCRILPRIFAIVLGLWSLLVIASVLTTFQHHFIDIPAGLVLGLAVVWLLPFDRPSPLAQWRLTDAPDRLRLGLVYLVAALAFAAAGILIGGGGLWLLWPALAALIVALAYVAGGPGFFGKAADGSMPAALQLLLAPYLLFAWGNSRFWTRKDRTDVEIVPGVSLGRFPSRADAARFVTVIDVTAELPRSGDAAHWRSFPMLDLVAPESATLMAAADAVAQARSAGPVRVNCALGYGRSVCVVLAYLTRHRIAPDLDTAIAMVREKRPRMSIRSRQLAALRNVADV